MKRAVSGCCIAMLLMGGCAENSPPPPAQSPIAPATQASSIPSPAPAPTPMPLPVEHRDDPLQREVARINNEPVTLKQLLDPLLESHGLTVLINLLELKLVQQDAANAGITISDADFQAERDATLGKMFKDNDDRLQDQIDKAAAQHDSAQEKRLKEELHRDNEQLLEQFLGQKNLTRSEFESILRINTYLRKLAEPGVNRSITEASLRSAFNQLYGETVLVRHIQLKNQSEVAEAQRRLSKGEKFGDVARVMSHNRLSGELDGELPRFSRQAPGYPENFKDVAFSLQPGQVSDPVEANGAFHLIKMEARFAPEAVKYDSVRDAVRKQLFDAAVQSLVKKLREDLAQRVVRGMKIEDPVLHRQYQLRVDAAAARGAEKDGIRQDLERERLRQSTTAPGNPAAVAPREDGAIRIPAETDAHPTPAASQPSATQPAAGK